MGSVFETLLFYSWFTALLSAVVVWRYKERLTELITIPIASVALAVVCQNQIGGGELPLILKTLWFEVHVLSSFAAYSFFTLAFSGAVFYIFLRRRLDDDVVSSLQDIAGKCVLWGFFFFSASMFAGAVWAYLAWGIYWLWEPKVLWSFIVWFWFAGVMHAWHVREWKGMGLSIATVLGFFVTVFTYLGVGLLMKSSHSF
jgi:ABC-type transport system involved in cytochrome c biogenesis permease subunit